VARALAEAARVFVISLINPKFQILLWLQAGKNPAGGERQRQLE
jgi:hypothetical protein